MTELINRRSERAKHFQISGNTFLAEIGNHSHYRDWANGGAFVDATNDDEVKMYHGWQRACADRKPLKLRLGENPNANGRNRDLIEFGYNDGITEHWVTAKSLKLSNGSGNPVKQGIGDYTIADTNFIKRVRFNERKVWQSYEYTSAADLPSLIETSFLLGVTIGAPVLANGGVNFPFISGGLFLRLEAPFLEAVFSDRPHPEYHTGVYYTVTTRIIYGKDCYVVQKNITPAGIDWLTAQLAAGAVYVSIDPTTTLQPGSAGFDNYITSNSLLNFGSFSAFYAGDGGSDVSAQRMLLKFDLSSISTGNTVTAATLSLKKFSSGGTSTWAHEARRLLRDWTETGSTWNVYSGGSNWGTAGAANDTDRSATLSASTSIAYNSADDFKDWSDTQLTTDIHNFVNGVNSNYGWIITNPTGEYQPGTPNFAYIEFRTSDYGTAGDRPKLAVTYTPTVTLITSGLLNIISSQGLKRSQSGPVISGSNAKTSKSVPIATRQAFKKESANPIVTKQGQKSAQSGPAVTKQALARSQSGPLLAGQNLTPLDAVGPVILGSGAKTSASAPTITANALATGGSIPLFIEQALSAFFAMRNLAIHTQATGVTSVPVPVVSAKGLKADVAAPVVSIGGVSFSRNGPTITIESIAGVAFNVPAISAHGLKMTGYPGVIAGQDSAVSADIPAITAALETILADTPIQTAHTEKYTPYVAVLSAEGLKNAGSSPVLTGGGVKTAALNPVLTGQTYMAGVNGPLLTAEGASSVLDAPLLTVEGLREAGMIPIKTAAGDYTALLMVITGAGDMAAVTAPVITATGDYTGLVGLVTMGSAAMTLIGPVVTLADRIKAFDAAILTTARVAPTSIALPIMTSYSFEITVASVPIIASEAVFRAAGAVPIETLRIVAPATLQTPIISAQADLTAAVAPAVTIQGISASTGLLPILSLQDASLLRDLSILTGVIATALAVSAPVATMQADLLAVEAPLATVAGISEAVALAIIAQQDALLSTGAAVITLQADSIAQPLAVVTLGGWEIALKNVAIQTIENAVAAHNLAVLTMENVGAAAIDAPVLTRQQAATAVTAPVATIEPLQIAADIPVTTAVSAPPLTGNFPAITAAAEMTAGDFPVLSAGGDAQPMDGPIMTAGSDKTLASMPAITAKADMMTGDAPLVVGQSDSVAAVQPILTGGGASVSGDAPVIIGQGLAAAPDFPVITASAGMVSAAAPMITLADLMLAPDFPIITRSLDRLLLDGPVITKQTGIKTADGPVITATAETVSGDLPAITAQGDAVAADFPIISGQADLVSGELPIVTVGNSKTVGAMPVITNQSRAVIAAAPVITIGNAVKAAGLPIIMTPVPAPDWEYLLATYLLAELNADAYFDNWAIKTPVRLEPLTDDNWLTWYKGASFAYPTLALYDGLTEIYQPEGTDTIEESEGVVFLALVWRNSTAATLKQTLSTHTKKLRAFIAEKMESLTPTDLKGPGLIQWVSTAVDESDKVAYEVKRFFQYDPTSKNYYGMHIFRIRLYASLTMPAEVDPVMVDNSGLDYNYLVESYVKAAVQADPYFTGWSIQTPLQLEEFRKPDWFMAFRGQSFNKPVLAIYDGLTAVLSPSRAETTEVGRGSLYLAIILRNTDPGALRFEASQLKRRMRVFVNQLFDEAQGGGLAALLVRWIGGVLPLPAYEIMRYPVYDEAGKTYYMALIFKVNLQADLIR